eukprot:4263291-Amphidinium_carterae.1
MFYGIRGAKALTLFPDSMAANETHIFALLLPLISSRFGDLSCCNVCNCASSVSTLCFTVCHWSWAAVAASTFTWAAATASRTWAAVAASRA